MRYLGKNMLTLGYSIFLSELLLAPFIPSNTARGGGIVLPIVMSLVNTLHSTPSENQKVGQFLILCGSHANLLISSLFITGAAPNPIVVGTALKILNIQITFSSWTLGAIVPVVTCLILLPLFFHSIYKPEYDGRVVCEEAEKQLLVLGPMSSNEIKLCIVLGISLILWITGDYTEIPETFVAFLAMVALLILNVLSWTEISSNAIAWDTFYWLSGMLVLAEQLSKLGVSAYIGSHVALLITNITLDTLFATILLSFFYFISMILFSSITGHAIALVGPFLSAGKHLGLAPWLSAILIGFFSSLSACFTHFSTGTVVLYYSQGYFTQQRWWMIGGAVATLYLTIYFTVGLLWLKSLGYY
jgi:DASS family divalent anion:Na+ symporter